MFSLGAGELVIILVIVLVVFGGGRLADLGTQLGEGIKNFKKGYRDSKSIDVSPISGPVPPQSVEHSGDQSVKVGASKEEIKR